MEKLVSLFVCVIIAVGFAFRARKRLHVSLMVFAFVVDVGLLLYIELTRLAIKTAMTPPHPFVSFHVAISIGTVVLYLVQIGSGVDRLRTRILRVLPHRVSGTAFLVFRGMNFATSLFLSSFVRHL